MKSKTLVVLAAAAALSLPVVAAAQNVALVNGKPVPKARVDALLKQAQRAGQPLGPEIEKQARDQVVLREIFAQEAERRGIPATAEFQDQMKLARESILIRDLFDDYMKKHPVSDAEASVSPWKPRWRAMNFFFCGRPSALL